MKKPSGSVALGVLLMFGLIGCGPQEQVPSFIAPPETLTEGSDYMLSVFDDFREYVPEGKITEEAFGPDQKTSPIFCAPDLETPSKYIQFPRRLHIWAEDSVDLVAILDEIERDYAEKPDWETERPTDGTPGPKLNLYNTKTGYFFLLRTDGYFAATGWSPCFLAPDTPGKITI